MESLKEKSGFRLWRDRKSAKVSRRKTAGALQDAEEGVVSCQQNGQGQVTRVKILVKKENLEKVLQAIRANTGKSSTIEAASSSLYLEECINAMKRRRALRANQVKLSCRNDSSWRPALDSIPECRVA
ncbi:hypothetical protein DCAR_0103376 [Daucus carota subsp. sativus]|uniref:Uncharacterized protein n=1 Tax=Daucus carota subsp. sativus TaxID=79200 RepID=A0A166HYA8_DAUCS|nr:hypothetical protein DCAR_0103376 [Daucus carota subsp. sativus]